MKGQQKDHLDIEGLAKYPTLLLVLKKKLFNDMLESKQVISKTKTPGEGGRETMIEYLLVEWS